MFCGLSSSVLSSVDEPLNARAETRCHSELPSAPVTFVQDGAAPELIAGFPVPEWQLVQPIPPDATGPRSVVIVANVVPRDGVTVKLLNAVAVLNAASVTINLTW